MGERVAMSPRSSLNVVALGLFFVALASAHSSLIKPKPRNAIDSELPEWHGGKSPYVWQPHGNVPCACRNGTDVCDSAQTCLWMSVGCTIGCKECDGGSQGGANPNGKDRCGSGMKATINKPEEAWAFPPPCYEPRYPDKPLSGLSEGRCSGQWMNNITIYDQLKVPEHLEPGDYVLGLRWDCETSAQIWQSCADVTITAPKKA